MKIVELDYRNDNIGKANSPGIEKIARANRKGN